MKKQPLSLITRRNKIIVLAFCSCLMFYVFAYLLNPYDIWWRNYFNRPVKDILIEWSISLVFCLLISVGSIIIQDRLNLSFSWKEKPRKRLVIEAVLIMSFVILLVFIQLVFIQLLSENGEEAFGDNNEKVQLWQWFTISIIIGLFVSTIHTGDYLITSWKNADLQISEQKLLAAQHRQAATEAELQGLKLQLDPHFVFNNLSVLSELILQDQQLGYQYSENFSRVYRYLLVNSKKDLITVEEEMKFLNAYLFLLKQRAGSGLLFEIAINTAHLGLKLPPLTLQLLIENAMKHNKILKSNPLVITVKSSEDQQLVISNALMPLDNKSLSAGMGLKNIKQRYELLTKRVPVIEQTSHRFTVTIPLIN